MQVIFLEIDNEKKNEKLKFWPQIKQLFYFFISPKIPTFSIKTLQDDDVIIFSISTTCLVTTCCEKR